MKLDKLINYHERPRLSACRERKWKENVGTRAVLHTCTYYDLSLLSTF
jgi:hypothetical protein